MGFIEMEVRSLGEDGHYEIDVKDSGDGFDWQSRTAADFMNDEASKRGRGLLVMQALADRVEYFDGGCRTVVTTTLNSGLAVQ